MEDGRETFRPCLASYTSTFQIKDTVIENFGALKLFTYRYLKLIRITGWFNGAKVAQIRCIVPG